MILILASMGDAALGITTGIIDPIDLDTSNQSIKETHLSITWSVAGGEWL